MSETKKVFECEPFAEGTSTTDTVESTLPAVETNLSQGNDMQMFPLTDANYLR